MTQALFLHLLTRLDASISQTPRRKILLIIDNCYTHVTLEGLSMLRSVTVEFLPPNATSCIQPLDAGIISTLK